jgi:hypothetical protein
MKILLFFLLFDTVLVCFGQQNKIDKSFDDKLVDELSSRVDSFFESDFLIKNGRYYIPRYQRVKGHPYFNDNKWTTGNVLLGSCFYPNVQLLFDLYLNGVICAIKLPGNDELPLILNNDIITSFDIGGHSFINSKTTEGLPGNGFYEIIYQDGKLKAYAKWTKKFLNIYTRENLGEFDVQRRILYLSRNGKTYEISSKNIFLNSFGDKKKKIKAYMHKNRMKFIKMTNLEFSDLFRYAGQLDN